MLISIRSALVRHQNNHDHSPDRKITRSSLIRERETLQAGALTSSQCCESSEPWHVTFFSSCIKLLLLSNLPFGRDLQRRFQLSPRMRQGETKEKPRRNQKKASFGPFQFILSACHDFIIFILGFFGGFFCLVGFLFCFCFLLFLSSPNFCLLQTLTLVMVPADGMEEICFGDLQIPNFPPPAVAVFLSSLHAPGLTRPSHWHAPNP